MEALYILFADCVSLKATVPTLETTKQHYNNNSSNNNSGVVTVLMVNNITENTQWVYQGY